MRKVVFFALIGFLSLAGSARHLMAESVLLWDAGDGEIRGALPAIWRAMSADELEEFSEKGGEVFRDSGLLVAGFRLRDDTGRDHVPFILALVNSGPRIPREQMQKMYSWFEKNRELVADILPARMEAMTIEGIEFLTLRATVLFQARMSLAEKDLSAVTGIIFLRNGYLNLFCVSDEQDFQLFSEGFYSFVKSVAVSKSLRYDSAFGIASEYFFELLPEWLQTRWPQIVGVAILAAVFGVMFRPGRQD